MNAFVNAFPGRMSVLGYMVRGTAKAEARNGAIVLTPVVPFQGVSLDPLRVTPFNERAVSVDQIHAVSVGSAYRLTASSHYR